MTDSLGTWSESILTSCSSPAKSTIIRNKTIKLVKLNNLVLEKLISSSEFKNAIHKYLAEDFIAEQKAEISWKLLTLVKKWKTVMHSHNIDAFKSLCSSIEIDAKFKLPWTVHELSDAIDFFVQLMDKYVDNEKEH